MKSTREHDRYVLKISKQMLKNYQLNTNVRIYHGASNSTRVLSFRKNSILNISHLNKVLKINKAQKYAVVEPSVPLDKLVDETLKYGLIPPVVMEFPGITVGGGIQGGAGESSSFKWGLFDESFGEYEIVLGNGKILTASKSKNSDLFYGIASSYGSIGITTCAKLKLISAKKYVRLTYIRTNNFQEALGVIKSKTKENVDFVDGILFSKNLGVAMIGVMVDGAKLPNATFSKATDDWFYVHAEKVAKKYKVWEEIIPIREYLFRYDRGAFWTGRFIFKAYKVPFNKVTRFLLDPVFKTRRMYRFLQALKTPQNSIIQDLILPNRNAEKFLNFARKKIKIYPVWLCPLKLATREFLSPTFIKEDSIDIGIWQRQSRTIDTLLRLNRVIEDKLKSLGGRKVMYAHSYYSEKDFWSIYDHKKYDKLREKYFAKRTLPNIYEKVTVKEKYKISYFGGLISFLRSPTNIPIN